MTSHTSSATSAPSLAPRQGTAWERRVPQKALQRLPNRAGRQLRRLRQEASIIGTAVDETRAVLAGVSVIATDQASGRQLSAMTNTRGEYRLLNVPPGTYALQAEIAGFATVML